MTDHEAEIRLAIAVEQIGKVLYAKAYLFREPYNLLKTKNHLETIQHEFYMKRKAGQEEEA